MRWMMVVVLLLLGLGAGVLVGWLRMPHYAPPQVADEGRLRERAADYYRAQRTLDYKRMLQLCTPARQLKQQEELAENLANNQALYRGFDEETLDDQRRSADEVSPGELQVELEGDWAATSGQAKLHVAGTELPFDLEKLVWVRTGGDWWMYQMEIPELGAYGCPTAEWRRMLDLRQRSRNRTEKTNPIIDLTGEQPPAPAVEGEAGGG